MKRKINKKRDRTDHSEVSTSALALEASSADLFSAQLALISSHFCETSAFCSPSVLSANFFISSISNGVLLLAEGGVGEGPSLPGPDPDEADEDMAAKGLVLHLAITLDVVLLVAAIEVRDGVIIVALEFDRRSSIAYTNTTIQYKDS